MELTDEEFETAIILKHGSKIKAILFWWNVWSKSLTIDSKDELREYSIVQKWADRLVADTRKQFGE